MFSEARPGSYTVRLLAALADNPILSTESGLLTVPSGPSETRSADTLDKLRQAVGGRDGSREGRAGPAEMAAQLTL